MSSNNADFLAAALRRAERRLRARTRLPEVTGARPKTAAEPGARDHGLSSSFATYRGPSSSTSARQPRPPMSARPSTSHSAAGAARFDLSRGSARGRAKRQLPSGSEILALGGAAAMPPQAFTSSSEQGRSSAVETLPSRVQQLLRPKTTEAGFATMAGSHNEGMDQRPTTEATDRLRPSSPSAPLDQLQGRVQHWTQCQAPRPPKVSHLLGAETVGWGAARMVVVLVADPLPEATLQTSSTPRIRLLTYNLKLQRWDAPPVEGEVPPILRNAAVCSWRVLFDAPAFSQYRRISKLLLCGGHDADGDCSDALYCLTVTEIVPTPDHIMMPYREVTWRWSRVHVRQGEGPGPRAFHAMCAHGNRAYVHGGMSSDGSLSSDFWQLTVSGDAYESSASWRLLAAQSVAELATEMSGLSSQSPRPRRKHTLCCHGDRLFLFGGEGDDPEIGGEVFAYHCFHDSWEELSGVRPGCQRQGTLRNSHSGCACGPLVLAVGGKIMGHCETTKKKISLGVRLLDTRDTLPAYASSMPANVDPRRFEFGSQLVAVSTNAFLLISGDCAECYIGTISIMDSPTVKSCRLSPSDPSTLMITTEGTANSSSELLVRIEHPVFTLTAFAERLKIETEPSFRSSSILWKTSSALPPVLLPDALQQQEEEECEPLPRDLNFRPPADLHHWQVRIPSTPSFIHRVGLAEGMMVVEIAASQDVDQKTIFTSDGNEFAYIYKRRDWLGLHLEQGGASSRKPHAATYNTLRPPPLLIASP